MPLYIDTAIGTVKEIARKHGFVCLPIAIAPGFSLINAHGNSPTFEFSDVIFAIACNCSFANYFTEHDQYSLAKAKSATKLEHQFLEAFKIVQDPGDKDFLEAVGADEVPDQASGRISLYFTTMFESKKWVPKEALDEKNWAFDIDLKDTMEFVRSQLHCSSVFRPEPYRFEEAEARHSFPSSVFSTIAAFGYRPYAGSSNHLIYGKNRTGQLAAFAVRISPIKGNEKERKITVFASRIGFFTTQGTAAEMPVKVMSLINDLYPLTHPGAEMRNEAWLMYSLSFSGINQKESWL